MNNKKNAGYVIVVVTVILVAISLMGMTFLNLTSIDFSASSNYVNSIQAEKVASAGLEYAMHILKMDKYGTDTMVYNNNSYRYFGTTTLGYDENYDAYTEEWLGTGTGKIFCNATTASNDVDNNGDGKKDSKWLDAPFSLDRGLKAQYAILIEDIGESRINVNTTGNVVGVSGSFVYGTGATTYDIRLQDILTDSIAKNVIGTNTGRCGANGLPGNTGTSASQFQPRNPVGDDRPYNVLDAADICFGTYTSSSIYQSRLRNIINNESLFQNTRSNLTLYSFDDIITNTGTIISLQMGNNYYRLNINTGTVTDLANQLKYCHGIDTLTADQIATHIVDYRDADDNITVYNSKYGLEVHPFINELFYATATAYHRVELINPFNRSISIGGWKLLVDKGGTVTTYTLGPAIISAAPSASNPVYFVLGDNSAVATLTTNLVVNNPIPLNIYDYDENGIPRAVTVTLKENSNNVIVDQVYPNAYLNTAIMLDLINALIQRVLTECSTIPPNGSLMNKLYQARDELEENPPDCEDAEPNLESFINEVEGLEGSTSPEWKACISNNADEFISRAQYILDTCENPPSARASIGQRKIPIVERSDNWTGSSTNHTIGTTNLSFNNIRQLVIANNNLISLGELGHLMTVGYNTNYSYTLDATYATSTNYVDNAKVNLFGGTFTTISDYFTILDPKNDSIDDDADGAIGTDTGNQSGDIDGPEIQVSGRININTASAGVLAALPGTSTNTSLATWDTLSGNTLISNIINGRPFSTIGAITSVTGMNYFGTDNADNDGDGFVDEKDEKDLIFTSISNLITTHSNVFAVYVTARIVNSSASQTFAEKKLVTIVDRSVNPVKIRYFRWMTEW